MTDAFEMIFEVFKETDTWKEMENTVEDSPWHRESSVAVHTQMTLDAYDKHFAVDRTPFQQLLTRVALMFHDAGKPPAEETVARDDGSEYRRYTGHERLSANFFMETVLGNPALERALASAGIYTNELRAIQFMIEYHLPYGIKKAPKRQAIRDNLEIMLGEDRVCFYDMLYSDSAGRISDDHETKLTAVREWIDEFSKIEPTDPEVLQNLDETKPTLSIVVGVPGAGKSTLIEEYAKRSVGLNGKPWVVFSLDELRLEMLREYREVQGVYIYGESREAEYQAAYTFCNNNPMFGDRANARYMALIHEGENIILDCTNTSRASRAFYATVANQKKKYNVVATELLIPLQVAIDRQQTRGDKTVPAAVVRSMYRQRQLVMVGPEAHYVMMHRSY